MPRLGIATRLNVNVLFMCIQYFKGSIEYLQAAHQMSHTSPMVKYFTNNTNASILQDSPRVYNPKPNAPATPHTREGNDKEVHFDCITCKRISLTPLRRDRFESLQDDSMRSARLTMIMRAMSLQSSRLAARIEKSMVRV
jgi:hypothetical protein